MRGRSIPAFAAFFLRRLVRLYLLDRSAVRTGVSATALGPATDLLASTLGKPVPGLFAKAGPFPPAGGEG